MHDTLTVGSLFTGIGGFDLGLERAGFEVKWHSEIDPYCNAVLKKHWPEVPNYGDITKIRNPKYVDLLCGGFPCQDLSIAGKGAGIEGSRSGLWSEFARLIREIRPRYVIVENVAALRYKGKGLYRVLADLAESGYDAEWDCIPASAVGAPHKRDRIWIIAYPSDMGNPNSEGLQGYRRSIEASDQGSAAATCRGSREVGVADANLKFTSERGKCSSAQSKSECGRDNGTGSNPNVEWEISFREAGESEENLADARGVGQSRPLRSGNTGRQSKETLGDRGRGNGTFGVSNAEREGQQRPWGGNESQGRQEVELARFYERCSQFWESEPNVGRVAHGVPARVDRIRSLGNALVPQIAEFLGRKILAWEESQKA